MKLLANALHCLAAHHEYIEPLREEISMIVEAEGWNKTSIGEMKKLDSFIKESQRIHGSDAGETSDINEIPPTRSINDYFI